MRTDKKKLLRAFQEKFLKVLQLEDWGPETEPMLRQTWQDYLKSVGCEVVKTPNGMLPFHSPNFIHLLDPANLADKDWHIQVPRHLAIKILAIGLP
jgi:hypothetical protein